MKVFVCTATNGPITLLIWEGPFRDPNGKMNRGLVFALMTPIINTAGYITNTKDLMDISGLGNFGTTSFDIVTTKVGDTFTLQSSNLYTLKVQSTPEVASMPVVNCKPRQPAQYRPAPQARSGSSSNPGQDVVTEQNQQILDYVNSLFKSDDN